MARILVIEEDEASRAYLRKTLCSAHQINVCPYLRDASIRLQEEAYDTVILDLQPGLSDGMELLQGVRNAAPYTPVIVTSRREKAEFIVKAIKAGAFDFIAKPYSADQLKLAVDNALENRRLKNEIDYLRRQQDVVYDVDGIVAVTPAMKKLLATIKKLADTDSTILMTGETGTGKSFISGAIHFNSHRRKRPFTKINCANIPETLLESELFGHGKGSFTGANKTRVGRLEQANGGTVFLDEIGELSPTLQAKLLRVLEDKSFERLGENRTIHADIRIIAATNRKLEEQVAAGSFREDLYYRVNVLRVHLPPLRERLDCIEPLAHYLLEKVCRSVRKQADGFTPEVIELLKRYSWPGNIRELSNTIERAVLLEDTRIIRRESVWLPEFALQLKKDEPGENHREDQRSLNESEKDLILRALEKSLWVQKDAAARLGVTPRVLHYKIKKYGITHSRWYKNN